MPNPQAVADRLEIEARRGERVYEIRYLDTTPLAGNRRTRETQR